MTSSDFLTFWTPPPCMLSFENVPFQDFILKPQKALAIAFWNILEYETLQIFPQFPRSSFQKFSFETFQNRLKDLSIQLLIPLTFLSLVKPTQTFSPFANKSLPIIFAPCTLSLHHSPD